MKPFDDLSIPLALAYSSEFMCGLSTLSLPFALLLLLLLLSRLLFLLWLAVEMPHSIELNDDESDDEADEVAPPPLPVDAPVEIRII